MRQPRGELLGPGQHLVAREHLAHDAELVGLLGVDLLPGEQEVTAAVGPELVEPPATRTLPSLSRTARWPARATFKVPAALQALVAGLYRSALFNALPPAPTP